MLLHFNLLNEVTHHIFVVSFEIVSVKWYSEQDISFYINLVFDKGET